MKTIVNKTHEPLRVPLPQGKILHLGPNRSGQISHNDVDHEPLQRLVADGKIEIEEDAAAPEVERQHDKGPHAETHGHHPPTGSQAKGDR